MKQPVDPSVGGLFRFRAELSYDGTDFLGWAKQPGQRTVEAELTKALELIFGLDVDNPSNPFGLTVAGRTDAGVHAIHQVCHLDLSPAQLKRLGRNPDIAHKLNGLLPRDIRVESVEPAPAGFDARFSALGRRYRYRITDDASKHSPLEARFTLEVVGELDLAAMNSAAKHLLGLHDFAAFCKPREGATTIRELREIKIERSPASQNSVIEVEIEADAFCHNMVRSIVGALIVVGQGKAEADAVRAKLEAGTRKDAFKVVSAHGLQLIQVGYPADDQLASQAEKARKKRKMDDN